MEIQQYINKINRRYQRGNATKYTFWSDLHFLVEGISPSIKIMNDPTKEECGLPDHILVDTSNTPAGYIEAINIGANDLEGKKSNKEQFDKYKAGLKNLIITDYINFHFYHEGECNNKIAIAKITTNKIKALPENFAILESLIKSFCQWK